MAVKAGRAVWAKRVERWKESGLTAKEFAIEIGVNPRTLSHWKWMLSKGERGREKTGVKKRTKAKRAAREPVSFTELTIEVPAVSAQAIEIVVDARRVVRVGSRFDGDALRRVLEVHEVHEVQR